MVHSYCFIHAFELEVLKFTAQPLARSRRKVGRSFSLISAPPMYPQPCSLGLEMPSSHGNTLSAALSDLAPTAEPGGTDICNGNLPASTILKLVVPYANSPLKVLG